MQPTSRTPATVARKRCAGAQIGFVIAAWLAAAQAVQAQEQPSAALIPSAGLSEYLATAPQSGDPDASRESFVNFSVRDVPADSLYAETLEANEVLEQPLVSATRLSILLNPNLTPEQVDAALEEHGLVRITESRTASLSLIGAVVVDASEALEGEEPESIDSSAAVAEAPIVRLARQLSSDERFIAVTPDSVQTPHQLRSAIKPEAQPRSSSAGFSTAQSETSDWGIGDIQIEGFWPQLGDVRVGVIDVGFADHEDLQMLPALSSPLSSNDHGNHVAGIMCAKHNSVGIRGVLPKCTVLVSSGEFLLDNLSPIENDVDPVSAFHTLFSELVSTTLDFIVAHPDVKTINLSLGFNWLPNFNIDPRDPGGESIRNMVRDQGRFFASVLALAKQNDIALVSAAGNDSSSLPTPLPAMWASPFNFGASLIETIDGWSNGVVVEAHDATGNRAVFSNVDGQLSCPGVNVLSALASGPSAYGLMSGTSMASPYCAAGLEALRRLRPDLSLREAIDCLEAGPDLVENRVPRLNVAHAVTNCATS